MASKEDGIFAKMHVIKSGCLVCRLVMVPRFHGAETTQVFCNDRQNFAHHSSKSSVAEASACIELPILRVAIVTRI